MKLKINGKVEEINNEDLTVSELLNVQGVENIEMVSVQLNNDFLEKNDYGNIILKENDEVEFLYFMGGGSK